ncbi:phospho-sugar mutase [Butyrivibrio sp. MC2013]|uniref:phospho-sugar mutase n=1 Tax=Butyrivibrio sp. MC2013 TaxID=1280686 RepID=UPI0004161737|nr:phospho-sugar mutase [Butyrivibrio sp. MC2013]
MNYKDNYQEWLQRLPKEDPLYAELESLVDNKDDKELEERFYQNLSFGTAGLRGKIGVGTNMMNYYTVGRATQGISDYICSKGEEAMKKGLIIAHDCRHFSPEFSRFAASIFAANNIKVYVFPDLRPTPELAYMIRRLGTVSGINITASHNPKDYNGYKAYWEDGCQVGSEVADAMTQCIEKVDYFTGVKKGDFDLAVEDGMITILGPEYDREYLDRIEALQIHSGDELDLSIPLVYTPLNGAGSIPFTQMLKDRGFTNWHIVEEQKDPDPDFTTVGYPNPEAPAAFKLSEELGRKVGAELLMATDPDSDRFAIEILSEDGSYVPLNGNQTGYLIVNYLLEGHESAGTLPANGAMVKSIVTSTMTSVMAEKYGVKMFESLTGFKNICGRIPFLEEHGLEYMFGYEESVGYSACPDCRDKDGISAGMLVAEAAAYYRKKGMNLWQVLMSLYEKYGYYAEDEPNLVLEGLEGARRIGRMMDYIRSNPPKTIADREVVRIIDYKDGAEDIRNPENFIPSSNVLRYFLKETDPSLTDSDTWFAVRPSGTEPKIKFYFYTKQTSREKALAVNKQIKDEVLALIESVK